MRPINDLLTRFKRFTLPNETVRKAAVEILNTKFRVPAEMSHISVRNGVMYVDMGPHIKMTIHTQKKAILASLRDAIGDQAPMDIR